MGEPKDPNIRHAGYQPPQGGPELLARYEAGERLFARARLSGADLSGADLRGADLQGAILLEAKLHKADLSGANLEGANLLAIKGLPKRRTACILDSELYRKSRWPPEQLVGWHRAGAVIPNLEGFPDDAKYALFASQEGLTLYFNTHLTPFDRYLVDGTIFGVLGRETDCHVVQYEERGAGALVRLVRTRAPRSRATFLRPRTISRRTQPLPRARSRRWAVVLLWHPPLQH